MKNLIYQFWDNGPDGKRTNLPGVKTSWKNIKQYADRIGAVHIVEENPPPLHNLKNALYYGAFNPVVREEFHEYDNVLFLDSDIHPVEGLKENIFEGFDADIGLCTEPLQPRLRAETKVGKVNRQQTELWANSVEQKWNITLPRTKEGFLKVHNGGVVLYSNKGMVKAKRDFIPFEEYVNHVMSIKGLQPYFTADQEYLQVTLFASKMDFVELDNGWNTLATFHERDPKRIIFDRNENTKFVHPMGIIGVHHYSEEQLWKLTNLPVEEWGQDCKNVIGEIKQ